MSQKAAIEAEKERLAAQRHDQRERWINRAKIWGVLVVGIALSIVGLGSWAGAGFGADGEVTTIERMTEDKRTELEQTRQEFEELWAEVSSEASGVDAARIEADSTMISELVLPLTKGEQQALAAAEQAGLGDQEQYLTEFVPGGQQALGDFETPVVHEQTTQLHEVEGSLTTYVSTVWFTDLVKKPVNQAEPIEPSQEHSAWAVVFFTTGPDGQIQQIQARWAQTPPMHG